MYSSLFNLNLLNESEAFTGLGLCLHTDMTQHTRQSQEKSTVGESSRTGSLAQETTRGQTRAPGPLIYWHLPQHVRTKAPATPLWTRFTKLKLDSLQCSKCHSDIWERLSYHKGAETHS